MPAPKYLEFLTCPRCSSTDLKRHGTHTKGTEHFGEQLVKCKKCGYKSYVTNFGGLNLDIAPISPEQREIERQKRRNSRLNTTASDITRQRMSESHKQNPVAFWKDKKLPQSTRDKMSESRKGRKTWNKGIPSSESTKLKQSISLKNKPKPKGFREKVSGERNHNWKGGVSKLEKAIRALPEMYIWRFNVMKRDNFCDCFTGLPGNHNLEAHHIKPLAIIIQEYNLKTIKDALNCEELWDINNGITMFKESHIDHHRKYGLEVLPKEYFKKK